MRSVFTYLLVCAVSVVLNAQSLINLLDSSYYYSWNTTLTAWAPTSKSTYSYDTNYLLQNGLHYQATANNQFTTNGRTVNYIYDSNGNMLEYISQNFVSGTWVNTAKSTYTYNTNNIRISALTQVWTATASAFTNASLISYTINANNKIQNLMVETWNSSQNNWMKSSLNTYSYNINNEWNRLTNQSWSQSQNTFTNNVEYTNCIFNNNDRVYYEYKSWDPTTQTYTTGTQYFRAYHPNHTMHKSLAKNYNTQTQTFINSDSTIINLDGNGNMADMVTMNWNTGLQQWINSQKTNYYYRSITVTSINENKINDELTVFPNPCQNYFVMYVKSGNKNFDWKLLDILGNTVQKGNESSQELKINTSNLANGIYFIRINNPEGTVTKRVLKN